MLTAAVPFLFLHVEWQPSFSVGVGSTTASASLADVAVWVVALAAVASLARDGAASLRTGLPVWATGALFFAWILIAIAFGRSRTPGYASTTHLVTAAKLLEYAALAFAVPLLVRGTRDLAVLLGGLTVWSALASAVGIAQFCGAAIFGADGTVGGRQASFLSSLDFTALSMAAIFAGGVGLLQPRLGLDCRVAWLALTSGVLGTVVGASLAGVLGLVTGTVAVGLVLLVRRELRLRAALAVAACVAVAIVGAVVIRSADLSGFASFLGQNGQASQQAHPKKVQTYAHRTLLVWLGFEIWKEHPILGSGFEASGEPGAFMPHLAAAHRRFPDEAPLAFPSPDRRYGVQNLYVQTLADMGVVGLALLAAFFGSGLWLAARAAIAGDAFATLAVGWLALLVWLWTAQGIVAGIPLDALLFLALGLAAAAAARTRLARD